MGVDKSWIDVEKVYVIINPEDGPLVHKETNKILPIFSNYIGVTANPCEWVAQRWSELENKSFSNGNFDNEETAAHASDTLARELMNNGEKCHMLNFPRDDIEVYGKNSGYFGVTYKGVYLGGYQGWRAYRWSKNYNQMFYNGYYRNEVSAVHASDTLARALMAIGEHGHILNFPDKTFVIYEKQPQRFKSTSSNYIGVTYKSTLERWRAHRWNKQYGQLIIHKECYKYEETAAHASDTLARRFIHNGESGHKLNFADDETVIYPKERNKRNKSDHEDSQNN